MQTVLHESKTKAPAGDCLVVEIDEVIRMAVCEYLRECGFLVLEARSCTEATVICQSGKAVDVVLVDLGLPGENEGFAFAQWVRRERSNTRIILTSGVSRTAQEADELCDDGG